MLFQLFLFSCCIIAADLLDPNYSESEKKWRNCYSFALSNEFSLPWLHPGNLYRLSNTFCPIKQGLKPNIVVPQNENALQTYLTEQERLFPSLKSLPSTECSQVTQMLLDGLIPVDDPENHSHVIVYISAAPDDFHYIRSFGKNQWYHKPGMNDATYFIGGNFRDKNSFVSGKYQSFCGFWVPSQRLKKELPEIRNCIRYMYPPVLITKVNDQYNPMEPGDLYVYGAHFCNQQWDNYQKVKSGYDFNFIRSVSWAQGVWEKMLKKHKVLQKYNFWSKCNRDYLLVRLLADGMIPVKEPLDESKSFVLYAKARNYLLLDVSQEEEDIVSGYEFCGYWTISQRFQNYLERMVICTSSGKLIYSDWIKDDRQVDFFRSSELDRESIQVNAYGPESKRMLPHVSLVVSKVCGKDISLVDGHTFVTKAGVARFDFIYLFIAAYKIEANSADILFICSKMENGFEDFIEEVENELVNKNNDDIVVNVYDPFHARAYLANGFHRVDEEIYADQTNEFPLRFQKTINSNQ